jgi:hypothetical protein
MLHNSKKYYRHVRWIQYINQHDYISKTMLSEHLWLILVILAIQEAEIRRTEVQSQPGQIVS